MIFHTSVLLQEVLRLMGSSAGQGFWIDGTTGEGGHAEAILRAFPALELECWDADADIQKVAKERLAWAGGRVRFRLGWFDELWSEVEGQPGGVLLDLGISGFHYFASGRGFSFQGDEPLDMRLSGRGSSAADLVNTLPEKDLEALIRRYSEERMAGRIARAIARSRPHTSSEGLAAVVSGAVPKGYEKGRIHPATRTFQALRIAVNDELARLERGLELAFGRLAIGGRLGVISFHSLEDREVKRRFRDWARSCVCPPEVLRCQCGGHPLGKLEKDVRAGEAERLANPASRSAKLRVILKERRTRHDD